MAGRPQGSLSKNSKYLLNRLKEMYGKDFEPILKMAENADTMQKVVNAIAEQAFDTDGTIIEDKLLPLLAALEKSINSWDKVGAYTNAKLKAIEHSQDPDNPLTESTTEALERRLVELGYTKSGGSSTHH